ncbi:MAG: T9SS type A sorting domain-containing protein, partial [Bacteroidota bacterium]
TPIFNHENPVEKMAFSFEIQPNPSRENVLLQFNKHLGGPVKISIIQTTGQIAEVLLLDELTANGINIPIGHLPKGTYQVQIEHEDQVSTQTLIVQ